ncbi:hypothetical protein Q7C36_000810 [Tachysurus vachellii]|uniref:Uncharacterized protein n=1 Tax=Tachysurus vachellii TaxID=175792 RepID=A0AA88TAU2_TACVA|nr:hypothetical protein Q7C36_000810 [Tachysurus vachellii]
MPEKYRRILPVRSLRDVENPWKGISLNRCILVALAILVLSSGAEMVEEKLEPLFEVVDDGSIPDVYETSWWETLAFWNKDDDFLNKNRAAMQPGERPKKREIPGKLLKEKN